MPQTDTLLHQCDAMRDRLEAALGPHQDWLGRYRTWLDANHIPAESLGWPSTEAFADANVSAFIAAMHEKHDFASSLVRPFDVSKNRPNLHTSESAPPVPEALPEKSLTFAALRAANVARLPLFKNRRGGPAHSQPDGSDWSLGEWCNAVLGELGEAANLIKKVKRGDMTLDEARPELAKEYADVVTYLDILAFRSGVDLGAVTAAKWDEVSERVGVSLRIADFDRLDAREREAKADILAELDACAQAVHAELVELPDHADPVREAHNTGVTLALMAIQERRARATTSTPSPRPDHE